MNTLSQNQGKREKQYRIKNWHAYNESLVKRGSITLWLDTQTISTWYTSPDEKEKKEGLILENFEEMKNLL